LKLVYISTMLPTTHYSQYLCVELSKVLKGNFIVYADNNPKNLQIKNCGTTKPVWRKGINYIVDILRELKKDNPDIIHIQHEINMYGGLTSAILFPFLLAILRLKKYQVVTTVHAVVKGNSIDNEFVRMFNKNPSLIWPFLVRLFFVFLYHSIGLLSDKIIVHTNLIKSWFFKYFKDQQEKIKVIPHGVPNLEPQVPDKEKFFLYFGYISNRKGLDELIKGFIGFSSRFPESGYRLVIAGGTIPGQEDALKNIDFIIDSFKDKEKITITGFIEHDEIIHLFSRAAAVVIPAKISISASGPLAQALSYGKCVLASKVGNYIEELEDQITGILVENNQWEDAFTFIVKNPDKVQQIEKNAALLARRRNWKNVAEKHIELYRRMLDDI